MGSDADSRYYVYFRLWFLFLALCFLFACLFCFEMESLSYKKKATNR